MQQAAREHEITIVCGMNERGESSGTLYNTVVLITPDGRVRNRHRKLMPTNPERMVWGMGDGSGLHVTNTPTGRIGTLICWENYMPLSRYALYAQNIELYIAPTYDSGEAWLATMGHIAREGRCWVLNCGTALRHADIPDSFPAREKLFGSACDWINPGDSAVFAPGGDCAAGPMHEQQGILFADIDIEQVALSKRALDVCGHYARPDIFTLEIDTSAQPILRKTEDDQD